MEDNNAPMSGRRWLVVTLILALAACTAIYLVKKIGSMLTEEKTKLKALINHVFERAERAGLIPHLPAFWRDYHDEYPHLKVLEDNYETICRECLELIARKEQLVDIEALAGEFTKGGIHAIQWKFFMFKSLDFFIEENCVHCPGTAAVLRTIPGLSTAFFSVLDPNQYIAPHWGYWRGFLRYHLGVIIPKNNEDKTCFLRINNDWEDNDKQDIALIEKGEKYYWHNGEGVIFDDNFLHDAANDSDEVRVVLWLDLEKKMPWYLHLLNRLAIAIASIDPSLKQVQKDALIRAQIG
jgi:ornithine lipid ester-linked acyl 2-hydroxylase